MLSFFLCPAMSPLTLSIAFLLWVPASQVVSVQPSLPFLFPATTLPQAPISNNLVPGLKTRSQIVLAEAKGGGSVYCLLNLLLPFILALLPSVLRCRVTWMTLLNIGCIMSFFNSELSNGYHSFWGERPSSIPGTTKIYMTSSLTITLPLANLAQATLAFLLLLKHVEHIPAKALLCSSLSLQSSSLGYPHCSLLCLLLCRPVGLGRELARR